MAQASPLGWFPSTADLRPFCGAWLAAVAATATASFTFAACTWASFWSVRDKNCSRSRLLETIWVIDSWGGRTGLAQVLLPPSSFFSFSFFCFFAFCSFSVFLVFA